MDEAIQCLCVGLFWGLFCTGMCCAVVEPIKPTEHVSPLSSVPPVNARILYR